MDVVERAHACTRALQNAVGASATAEAWGQIATYLEHVKPQVEGLRRQLGRNRALGSAPSLLQLKQVRIGLGQVRETFSNQPDQLGQGEAAGALRRALTDAVRENRNRADDVWTKMCEAVLSNAPEGLLRLYAAIPDARESARRASALRTRIASATKAPAEIEELGALKRAVDTLFQLLDELQSVPLPPDVHRFLDSALRGDARWPQVTPGVVEWLDKHNMLQTLRVKIV